MELYMQICWNLDKNIHKELCSVDDLLLVHTTEEEKEKETEGLLKILQAMRFNISARKFTSASIRSHT